MFTLVSIPHIVTSIKGHSHTLIPMPLHTHARTHLHSNSAASEYTYTAQLLALHRCRPTRPAVLAPSLYHIESPTLSGSWGATLSRSWGATVSGGCGGTLSGSCGGTILDDWHVCLQISTAICSSLDSIWSCLLMSISMAIATRVSLDSIVLTVVETDCKTLNSSKVSCAIIFGASRRCLPPLDSFSAEVVFGPSAGVFWVILLELVSIRIMTLDKWNKSCIRVSCGIHNTCKDDNFCSSTFRDTSPHLKLVRIALVCHVIETALLQWYIFQWKSNCTLHSSVQITSKSLLERSPCKNQVSFLGSFHWLKHNIWSSCLGKSGLSSPY